MEDQHTPEISVCICTYKRPALLLKLLGSLANQTFPLARFEVIVVDNDKLASAMQVIKQAEQLYPTLAVRYDICPTQGIAYARNRSVALAAGELIAFIDDDEWAVRHWLSDMALCIEKSDVDAVLGPVIPKYPAGSRPWVVKSLFFERPRFRTGTIITSEMCRTGNALIKACRLKSRQPLPFDERLAHSGGEDFDFFKWFEGQGGKAIWCDTAEVSEVVPVGRQTLRYMLDRGLRVSALYWKNINQTRSNIGAFSEAILGGGIGVAFAVLGLCLLPAGMHHAAPRWVTSAKGFGRVVALVDIQLTGYR
ncbi:glycosyltransferase family 2 protein [Accumulibacter sp.]|uniref:glycosyltransferase n=1 Tax=Accumulibacter sp. TaxID=2053492 RepID=UPI0026347C0F|nr:glycosyltransferase family 2 protein [Accumulibacter sp.]